MLRGGVLPRRGRARSEAIKEPARSASLRVARGDVSALEAEAGERFWNEHNFVVERDGLFLHGRRATPAWDGYAPDATGLPLVPLNMAEPALVMRGRDNPRALGSSPHGVGRSFSRAEHRRRSDLTAEAMLQHDTQGLDVRFRAGATDPHGRLLAGEQPAPPAPRSYDTGGSSAAATSRPVAAGPAASKWWAMERA